ncbi:cupin domain-containing protein [Spirosoma arcticum]
MKTQVHSDTVDTEFPSVQPVDSTTSTPTKPFVLRETEARPDGVYHLLGMDKYLKISGKDTNGQLSLFFGYYVKSDSAPLHVHYEEDEEFYILDGEVLFQVGTERYTLQSGDIIFLPRNIPHTYLVLSETAKMLFMIQPSGKSEAFFRKMSQLDSPVSPEEFGEIFQAHDLGLVGPPLTL